MSQERIIYQAGQIDPLERAEHWLKMCKSAPFEDQRWMLEEIRRLRLQIKQLTEAFEVLGIVSEEE
jgi:hypothetical protein